MSDDGQNDDEQQPQPPWPATTPSPESQAILDDVKAVAQANALLQLLGFEQQIIGLCWQVIEAVQARPYDSEIALPGAQQQHFMNVSLALGWAQIYAASAGGAMNMVVQPKNGMDATEATEDREAQAAQMSEMAAAVQQALSQPGAHEAYLRGYQVAQEEQLQQIETLRSDLITRLNQMLLIAEGWERPSQPQPERGVEVDRYAYFKQLFGAYTDIRPLVYKLATGSDLEGGEDDQPLPRPRPPDQMN